MTKTDVAIITLPIWWTESHMKAENEKAKEMLTELIVGGFEIISSNPWNSAVSGGIAYILKRVQVIDETK